MAHLWSSSFSSRIKELIIIISMSPSSSHPTPFVYTSPSHLLIITTVDGWGSYFIYMEGLFIDGFEVGC